MQFAVHPQTSVVAICDALGRREIAARLGRTPAAVGNAASVGIFPAGWYLVVREMCRDVGIECPESLFSFVPITSDLADPQVDAA